MTPEVLEPSFPLPIIILCFIATVVLVAILLLLSVINKKLSALSAKLSHPIRSTHAEKTVETGEEEVPSPEVEVAPGTHFEEFLNEEPERRNLPKKLQFKAYRDWRTEKGLNWKK